MSRRTPRARYSVQTTTTPTPAIATACAAVATPRVNLRSGKVICGEVAHQLVDLAQFLRRGQENDPQVSVRGRHPEARSIDAQDSGRLQKSEHVVFVGPARRQRDLRHHV